MAVLTWDEAGNRLFETGTSKGVLALLDDKGVYGEPVAWTGLTKVTEAPDGAEETPLYADDMKYLSLFSAENFKGTLGAYTYPDEFAIANGEVTLDVGIVIGQQARKQFGFAYRTSVGNDVQGADHGYKIHFIYGAKVQPSEKEFETVNDDPSAVEFEWDFVTTPVQIDGYKPTATLTVDSTLTTPANMKKIEDLLYGTADGEPKFPTPAEVVALVKPLVTP